MKRFVDLVIATAALLLSSPVLLLAAAAIHLEDRGPVFYRQTRAGRDGRSFELLKLRSMRINDLPVSAVGQVNSGHHLVTRVGRVIRRMKIDELPQLINVLAGDMSVVGPRPTIPEQVANYDSFQRRRLAVAPGLTGWAQVNGNVALSWEERILLDVWYVDHASTWLDLTILLKTLVVVIRGEHPVASALERARDHARRPARRSR